MRSCLLPASGMRSCLSCRRRGIGEWCVFVFGPFVSPAKSSGFRRPAKARIRRLWVCSCASISSVSRRPTHGPCAAPFAFLADGSLSVTAGILPSAPSGPASPFAPLLRRSACARESNQREHTLGVAPALCAVVAAGGRGFADSPSMDCDQSASAGHFRPPFAAAQRNPSQRNGVDCRSQGRRA